MCSYFMNVDIYDPHPNNKQHLPNTIGLRSLLGFRAKRHILARNKMNMPCQLVFVTT